MFKKILIANRGEIAIRIMKTCQEMGIRTVAVYSEVDQHAYHVREADEAYFIGPANATQSYLHIPTIIEVAQQSGAEAIHPGYGFLAENDVFAEACMEAGITFIGPPAPIMRLMGSKIAAKKLALEVGVPIVPGYNGEEQDDDTLYKEALQIGFPLLIKASAGGGGKGMRVVQQQADFLEQLAGARREAYAAFGDETVFLERLILQPRHIEVQILADTYGNVVHLGERECSIQRRHQKILEESPSDALTPALRAEMGACAVRLASAAGYVNAGTIEFILDEEQRFYFLEMNTRLQVEHPVTEWVTGVDLVRHQLAIAAGETLSLTQEQLQARGHAIEVRIYAEDPQHNFLPATGIVQRFLKPEGPGVRVDNGVESGDEITPYYDPMIAKLIVYGEDRASACARLQQALEHSAIFGVTTNLPLLHTISVNRAFLSGETTTDFLTQHIFPANDSIFQLTLPEEVLLAAALYDQQPARNMATDNPWNAAGPWRMIGESQAITYIYDQQTYQIKLTSNRAQANTWRVQYAEQEPVIVSLRYRQHGHLILQRDTEQLHFYVASDKSETVIAYLGQIYHLQRRQPPEIASSAQHKGSGTLKKTLTAPMAGTIVKVQVQAGDEVEAHQTLVILSAMKMEHAITAPYAGTVKHIAYQEGQVVQGGATVVEME